MNIQFVRLDDHVCEAVNRMALERRTTVSELVNGIVRAHLETLRESEPGAAKAG
jgi:hypothetical protein